MSDLDKLIRLTDEAIALRMDLQEAHANALKLQNSLTAICNELTAVRDRIKREGCAAIDTVIA